MYICVCTFDLVVLTGTVMSSHVDKHVNVKGVRTDPSPAFQLRTAPKNTRWRFWHLWGGQNGYNARIVKQIIMDETASFSVTPASAADEICRRLKHLRGITSNSRITDATACVGGNTVAFAREFYNVTAVELDEDRVAMLRRNLQACAKGARKFKHTPTVVAGDCTQVCPGFPQQDIIFIDPPWGGETYANQTQDTFSLSLSGIPLHRVCRSLFSSCDCKYVALKLPHNADLSGLLDPDDGPRPTIHCATCVTQNMQQLVLSYPSIFIDIKK